MDSARLGGICIENVCYVIKNSENPRVLLLALGTLNNLTKVCSSTALPFETPVTTTITIALRRVRLTERRVYHTSSPCAWSRC